MDWLGLYLVLGLYLTLTFYLKYKVTIFINFYGCICSINIVFFKKVWLIFPNSLLLCLLKIWTIDSKFKKKNYIGYTPRC